jgi:hypothetical protein
MKFILSLFLACNSLLVCSQAEVAIATWNLKDMGSSKSSEELRFIAGVLKNYDAIAIQEVVVSSGGPQAVAQLADELNRMGSSWDYAISNPTISTGNKQERYAFIWKKSRLTKMGDAWLEKKYAIEMEREPYLITFKTGGKLFTMVM